MKQFILKAILVLCLFTALFCVTAQAAGYIDPEQDVSLNVIYRCGETPIPGAQFDIYKVASVDKTADMTLTDEFDEFDIDLTDMTQKKWQRMALILKGRVQLNIKPLLTAVTDENGLATAVLKPGLYLVIGRATALNESTTCICDPFMEFLPLLNEEDQWVYSATAEPKNTTATELHKIIKCWDPDHPEEWQDINEVLVDVIRDGELYETVSVNRENNWVYEWEEELDPQRSHDWSFVEQPIKHFVPTYEIIGTTLKITNTYVSQVVYYDPPVEKTLLGQPPEDVTFTFVLEAENAETPMPLGSINQKKEIEIVNSGRKEFGAIEFTKPGDYHYTVYELVSDMENLAYDMTQYTLTVHVEETEDGLTAIPSVVDHNGYPTELMTFVNRYLLMGDELNIQKYLFGEPPADYGFEFVLKPADPGYPMPEGSQNGEKTITIVNTGDGQFGKINFTQAGDYSYTISEVKGELAGMIYDETVYTVSYHIEETQNGLESVRTITASDGSVVQSVLFVNMYTVTNQEITVCKKLTGKEPDKELPFEFTLEADDPLAPMPEGSENGKKQIVIKNKGTASFGQIEYTAAGDYSYTVSEKNSGEEDVTYDKEIYHVTVHVIQTDVGLSSEMTITTANGQKAGEIVFTNDYDPGEKIPQTGLLWWPVPVLMMAGLLLILLGAMRLKDDKNER